VEEVVVVIVGDVVGEDMLDIAVKVVGRGGRGWSCKLE
jgi:hypothetical protein